MIYMLQSQFGRLFTQPFDRGAQTGGIKSRIQFMSAILINHESIFDVFQRRASIFYEILFTEKFLEGNPSLISGLQFCLPRLSSLICDAFSCRFCDSHFRTSYSSPAPLLFLRTSEFLRMLSWIQMKDRSHC